MKTNLPVVALAALVSSTAVAGDFRVYSPDNKGGGWVIHDIPGRGDALYGCQDVASVDECQFVVLPYWTPASNLDFLHVSGDSPDHAGWLRVATKGLGDYVLACYAPEGDAPYCKEVTHELRPPALVSAKRHWPEYNDDGSGGGGMMKLGSTLGVDKVMGDKANSDMWLSLGIKGPGPINLYACRKLHSDAPECELAVPDFFVLDRANVGIKKFSADEKTYEEEGREYVKIIVEDVDEDTAADVAGLREGDVIVAVNGFKIFGEAHFKGLIAQFPATYSMELTFDDGSTKTVTVERKPKKK